MVSLIRNSLLICSLFMPALVQAESIVISNFSGVNNAVDSAVIKNGQSQDSLNVEMNKSGTGIRKRDGFGAFLNLSATALSVDSAFGFKNGSGNECLIIVASGTVYASVNQGTGVQVTTITAGARLRCANYNGTAYCFSSSNNPFFKYDCSAYSGALQPGYPNGSFNVMLPDRHLVGGTTDFPNRLYFSQSGTVDVFTTGNNTSSAFTEDVGTPGDKITAIGYLNGRTIVFKEYSILGINLTDQFNAPFYDIANSVGVVGPESLIQDKGHIYFKGSDNAFYDIDGSPGGIQKISVEISSTVASLLTGKTRYNIQTEKTDWDAGNKIVSGERASMSSNMTVGSIEPSSFTLLDTSDIDFTSGTWTSISTAEVSGTIILSSNVLTDTFDDGDLGSNPGWTIGNANWTVGTVSNSQRASRVSQIADDSASEPNGISLASTGTAYGSWSVDVYIADQGVNGAKNLIYKFVHISSASSGYSLDMSRTVTNLSFTVQLFRNMGGTKAQIGSDYTLNVSQGQVVRFNILRNNSGQFTVLVDGTSQITGTDTTYALSSGTLIDVGQCVNTTATNPCIAIDNIIISSYAPLGAFFSRPFDTSLSTPIGGTFTVSSSVPNNTTLSYQIRSGTAVTNNLPAGNWTQWYSIANLVRSTETNRYWQYMSSFTTTLATRAPSISEVSLIAATTGQYVTQCIQPGTSISAWGTLEAAGTLTCGTVVFAVSTGASCTDVGSSFTNQSTGTTIAIATGAAFQTRFTYGLNSATCTARIDSLTTNWTEGSVAPPSYGAYWNDALYWSVANSGITNNLMLKYDLLHEQWFPFSIPANALLNFNNILYFGSTSNGKVYKFSNINPGDAPTSDDGAAINAYWRSKDYAGNNPFTENEYQNISLIARKQSGGTASVTWNIGGGTYSGSYNVALSTGDNVVRHNQALPFGYRGSFFNLQIGNNSTIPFEILGLKIDYIPEAWKEMP